MNGAYIQGATNVARLSIAARSALELYYHQHPLHRYTGMTPNYNHYEGFMRIFVEQEDDISRLDERSEDESPAGLKRRKELTQRIKDRAIRIQEKLRLFEEGR